MPLDLEKVFDEEMMNIYRRAKSEAGYTASIFHKMLCKHRGLQTARILINAPKVSDGYTALWELRRLDLTVEALILDNPKWHPLFTKDEIEKVKKRLVDYQYKNAIKAG